jgi:hypothetical protein
MASSETTTHPGVRRLCVRLTAGSVPAVRHALRELDPKAQFDPEGNPVTLWVVTRLTWEQAEALLGVELAFDSDNQWIAEEMLDVYR